MLTVTKSENRKLGNCGATYRGKMTCPSDCPAFKACYGKAGFCNIQFENAGKEKEKSDTVQLVKWIASLAQGFKFRMHVTGDFLTDDVMDKTYIRGFMRAMFKRPDLKCWGYTHAWNRFKKNIFKKIASININASCDSISDIKAAKKKGFDTVIVMPVDAKSGVYDGERIVICPAQTAQNMNCEKCMICFRKNRDFSIGFRAHGPLKTNYKFEKGVENA